MALPILGANTESAAYDIANSLRYDGSTSRLTREFTQDPTSRKTFTISIWVKRSKLGSNTTFFNASTTNNFYDQALMFDSNDTLRTVNVASGSDAIQVITNRKFRDVAAWYHIVLAIDTTEAAVTNGVKFYINGVQETSFSATTYSQNATYELGRNGSTTAIGRQQLNGTQYFGGYMAEINYIDGQQLDPSYFGETNSKGVWTPIEYDGTYGNNGFYLEFKQTGTSQNSSGIGADTSGNDEHFAVSGVDAKDVCIDTPTNNFMTMNPLFTNSRGTFAEGNLMVTTDVQGSVPYGQVEFGGFAVNKGKWYYEAKINSVGSGGQLAIGWNERAESGGYINGHNNLGSNGNVWYGSSGKIQDGSTSNTTSPDSYTTNDVIGIACDFDNKKFYAHKNGTYQSNGSGTGNPSTGANGFTFNTHYNDYWTPWMSKDDTNNEATVEYNFGNPTFTVSSSEADDNGYGSFEYDVPTGYYSLCTKNLAEFG